MNASSSASPGFRSNRIDGPAAVLIGLVSSPLLKLFHSRELAHDLDVDCFCDDLLSRNLLKRGIVTERHAQISPTVGSAVDQIRPGISTSRNNF